MRFRKKPVEIEATQLTRENVGELAFYVGGEVIFSFDPVGVQLLIPTLEGTMTAREGDWIITGVQGEKYPCKPDIFEATYEAV